ncbi:MAG: GntR family transcriptional regulator [Clostridia bacterium]|nr:GntR family transcriptional regulator [Clostridia bacterium]
MANTPLYMQIYKTILTSIKNGEYKENTALPSERELCDKYFVSRSTIRQTISLLKEADFVYTIQGKGTFIKPQVFIQSLSKVYSFTDSLKSDNVIIQNQIIEYSRQIADGALARITGHNDRSVFHKLTRLRSAKDYPLMLETTYLPMARFIRISLETGSLYDYLRKNYNFKADRVKETLRPIIPQAKERKLLQLSSNIPCILLERFSYEDDMLIEYTRSIVRGDKYIFQVNLSDE